MGSSPTLVCASTRSAATSNHCILVSLCSILIHVFKADSAAIPQTFSRRINLFQKARIAFKQTFVFTLFGCVAKRRPINRSHPALLGNVKGDHTFSEKIVAPALF